MFTIAVIILFSVIGNLVGMNSPEEQLRKYQELKEEREARKKSGPDLKQKQECSEYSWPNYIQEQYQKRLIELEARLIEFEKQREFLKQRAVTPEQSKELSKSEQRAKPKYEEEELNARRMQEEEKVLVILNATQS